MVTSTHRFESLMFRKGRRRDRCRPSRAWVDEQPCSTDLSTTPESVAGQTRWREAQDTHQEFVWEDQVRSRLASRSTHRRSVRHRHAEFSGSRCCVRCPKLVERPFPPAWSDSSRTSGTCVCPRDESLPENRHDQFAPLLFRQCCRRQCRNPDPVFCNCLSA